MDLQRLLSYTRRAVDDYQMIEAGDRIAVGISGGKDSLTLLYALEHLKRFYPKPFELSAVTVDLGFSGFDLAPIEALCAGFSIPYHIIHTDIAKVVFEVRKEPSPCSLCAKMRKGALNRAVRELGCNKVAYAHHQDDIIETMFLSLIYEGRFYSFSPVTYLDWMDLTVIRPLMHVPEADIKGFQNKYQLPVVKNPCPADGVTRREYAKNLVRQINLENPGVKTRLYRAIIEGGIPGWPERHHREEPEQPNNPAYLRTSGQEQAGHID